LAEKSAVGIQSILDQVVPAMIPLGLTFLVYYFVKKIGKNHIPVIRPVLLGFAGSIIHLFA
jgi:fructoselysine and glucoselysine-specific PTS system IID component